MYKFLILTLFASYAGKIIHFALLIIKLLNFKFLEPFLFLLINVLFLVSKPFLEDIRIVGGEDIDITAAPYQVSILNRGRHSCGGSIIDIDLILTAAHCLVG